MKHSHLFLLAFLLLFANPGLAQKKGVTVIPTKKASVKFGPEVKAKKTFITDVLGSVGDNTYTLRSEIKGLFSSTTYVDKVNSKMASTKSTMVNDKKDWKAGKRLLGTIIANEHIYMVYNSNKGGKKGSSKILIQELNPESMQLSSKPKLTLNLQNNNPKAIVSFYGIGLSKRIDELLENGFDVSQNGSKILIYQSEYSVKNKEKEEVTFYVYDEGLNTLWEKKIVFPYKSELFSIEEVIVDNEGNVHLLAREYNEVRKTRKKGKANYKYHVLSYFDQGANAIDNIISLNKDFITDITVSVSNGNMVAAGFYSEDNKLSSIKGVFYLNMDLKSQQVVSHSKKEFSIDFMVENMKDSKAEKIKKKAEKGKEFELYEFDLDELIQREDGGTVLLAEKYYITVHTTTDSRGNMRTYYVYHYDDIIAVSISPQGQIEWANMVPKRQASRSPGGPLSYASAVCDDKVYLVFNDNLKNITEPKKGKTYGWGGKNSVVSMVTLSGDGKMEREVLYKPGKYDIILHPGVSMNTKNCELFLYNRRRNTHQYSQVSINK